MITNLKRGDKVDRLSCYEDAPTDGLVDRVETKNGYRLAYVEWPLGNYTWELEGDLLRTENV